MLSAAEMQYASSESLAFGSATPQLQRSMSWQPQHGQVSQYSTPELYASSLSAYDMRFGHSMENNETPVNNAVTKHPKVKLKIILSDHQFEAGGSISGALEITSSTSQRLRLGEIAVELEAFEELNSRDHSATQIFLFNRTLFQGEYLPPSNAVLPSAPVHGHWTARKGRTTFPFLFRLPKTIPSSVTFAGNAHLRYVIKGSAQTWWNETKSLVTVRSETTVLEKWQDEFDPRYFEPVEAVADSHIFMGGSGAVWLEAGVSEQLFSAGGPALVRAGIKNNTKRHISGIKVAIARRLILGSSGQNKAPAQRHPMEPQITEIMHTQVFKGHQFEFPPREEVMMSLPIEIPREVRTIRKTRLFEVEIFLQVSAQMGNFAKDLMVEFPIYVAHPSSLSSSTQARALDPMRGLPQRSQSAMSHHGYHDVASYSPEVFSHHHQHHQFAQSHDIPPSLFPQVYQDPQMVHLQQYGDNRGWSPAPVALSSQAIPFRQMSVDPSMSFRPVDQWTSFQEVDHSQSLHQYYDRPHSAMELARHYNNAPQVIENDVNRQYAFEQHRQALPMRDSYTPRQEYDDYPLEQLQTLPSASQSNNSITMSQLLNLGAIPLAGLTTIEEDSESAAGTIKSIRDVKGSITRTDVANLEAIASLTEISDIIAQVDESSVEIAEATSHTPKMNDLDGERDSQSAVSPNSSSDATILSDGIDKAEASGARVIPIRPTSAQGLGLSALESRLGSQKESNSNTVLSKIGKTKVTRTGQKGSITPQSGALRAAANAAVKRQNEAREEVRKLEMEIRKQEEEMRARGKMQEQKQDENVPVQPVRPSEVQVSTISRDANEKTSDCIMMSHTAPVKATVSPKKTASRAETEQASKRITEKERKTVDLIEQKKLNKEAVGRVAGWLSSSSSPKKYTESQMESDINKTVRTPSPSVIKSMQDPKTKEVLRPSTLQATNGASSRDDEMPSLSADLRALIDSSSLQPPPKAGKAIQSHIATKRFSTASKKEEIIAKAAKNNSHSPVIKVAASLSPTKLRVDDNRVSVAKKSSFLSEGNEENRYDARSARGGRGGKVASVANMWASIADGTDGSQVKSDEAPVLTLRPKALRGNAAGSNKLDFSKSKVKAEDVPKPSAREIFSSVALDKEDKISKAIDCKKNQIHNPSLKTTKAAHFINTTMPKPVFAKAASPISPSIAKKPGKEFRDEDAALDKLRESRKIVSDLIAIQGKLKAGGELSDDQIHIAVLPMNGRGTTKAIGREKLSDLRSLWGG